jgi:hypothetical protein
LPRLGAELLCAFLAQEQGVAAANQARPGFRRGGGVSKQTDRGYANRRIPASLKEAPPDTPPEADGELLRLCDECRSAHARWVEYFDSLSDNMTDHEPAIGELARLRSLWKKALDRLREWPPATPAGALAKQDLACTLKAWSGDDDVFEFFALTSREMSTVLCSSEPGPPPRTKGRLNGPRGFAGLDLLPRFLRFANERRTAMDQGARRSQT